MRTLMFIGAVTALVLWFPGSPRGVNVALGAGGGSGTGTTPPVAPNPPGGLTIPFSGAIAGQPDGTVALRLQLRRQTSLVATTVVLFEETCGVAVKGGVFRARLGACTAGGVPSSLVAPESNLFVRYAFDATPDTALGAVRLASPATALTLAPGATIDGVGGSPGLTARGARAGLDVASTGGSTRGVVGDATSTSTTGFTAGVEGRAVSPDGAGGNFVNTGGGDLLVARTSDGAGVVFRVDHTGDTWMQGVRVPEYGPKGADGDQGVQGPKGPTGNPGAQGPQGPVASFQDFGLIRQGSNCIGACKGPTHLKQAVSSADGGCAVTSQGVLLTWYGSDAYCCVCGL